MRVLWTEPAETDLDELFEYIARDSPIYAEQFTARILEAIIKLADFPRIGRRVPEADSENIRELIVQSLGVICLARHARIRIDLVVMGGLEPPTCGL